MLANNYLTFETNKRASIPFRCSYQSRPCTMTTETTSKVESTRQQSLASQNSTPLQPLYHKSSKDLKSYGGGYYFVNASKQCNQNSSRTASLKHRTILKKSNLPSYMSLVQPMKRSGDLEHIEFFNSETNSKDILITSHLHSTSLAGATR